MVHIYIIRIIIIHTEDSFRVFGKPVFVTRLTVLYERKDFRVHAFNGNTGGTVLWKDEKSETVRKNLLL